MNEDERESQTAIILEPKPKYIIPTISQVIPFMDKFLGSAIVDGDLTWFVAP